jgi:NADH-quinone oxidoreductase subunit F
MPSVRTHTLHRVLDTHACAHLEDYFARGGGRGLAAARSIGPVETTDAVTASGLRGRGGAGFPTGIKWRTVAFAKSPVATTSVVINGAEGEPGTFKDRELLRRNPFKVLEGALIAALAVDADEVVVALKSSFEHERRIVDAAIDEIVEAGWTDGVGVRVVLGPAAYLFGEETALLEVIDGRQPFPRVAPPYRRGLDPNDQPARRTASSVHLAGPGGTDESPALVDNVETLANVPSILAEGVEWFRSLGTQDSPGTLLSTVTGRT